MVRRSSKRAPARADKKPPRRRDFTSNPVFAAAPPKDPEPAPPKSAAEYRAYREWQVRNSRLPLPLEVPKDVLQAAGVPQDNGGLRHNAGKVQLELIPMAWTWALGQVLTRGAYKYAARNWERGMAWSYPIGCAMRHMIKFACGQRYDPETGCHHLAMAAWNMLALMTYDLRAIGNNDLGAGSLAELEATAVEPGPELAATIKAKLTAAVTK